MALSEEDKLWFAGRIDGLAERMNGRIDSLSERVDVLSERVDSLSERMGGLSDRVDGLSKDMDGMTRYVSISALKSSAASRRSASVWSFSATPTGIEIPVSPP
jgi:hypothetical protein